MRNVMSELVYEFPDYQDIITLGVRFQQFTVGMLVCLWSGYRDFTVY